MDNNSPIVKSLLKFREDLQLSNKLIFTPFCFTLGEFTKLFESVSPNDRGKSSHYFCGTGSFMFSDRVESFSP